MRRLVLSAVLLSSSCVTAPLPAPATPPLPPSVATVAEPLPATPPPPPPTVVVAPEDIIPPRITPDADFRAQKPKPGTSRPFKVPAVKRFRLRNGLPVILAESHKLPLVSFELVIKTGNAASPRGRAGLADLTANMLDEGTKTRDALTIADEISSLGASLQASGRWDTTSLAVSGLSDNIDKALAVWADVLLHPAFDQQEFNRVRDILLTAFKRRKDSPPIIAGVTLARVLYGEAHPYGWPVTGTDETLKAITPAELRTFWQTYYRPNNAVLVVAGDLTEAEVHAKVEPLLKDWKPGAVPKLTLPKAGTLARTRVFLIDKAGAPQSSVRMGLIGLERRNPDYYRALVMNNILGGSLKRLDLNLREAKGWSYGTGSLFDARKAPGPWSAGGEFVALHTADAVGEMVKEVKRLRDEDVPDKELQATKDELIKGFPARFATVNQIAGAMAALAVYDLPDNDYELFARRIAGVTTSDVRKTAQKYLTPDHLAIVVVGDQKGNEAALRKIADLELRDVDGNPAAASGGAASAPAAK
jgi:zinc protease